MTVPPPKNAGLSRKHFLKFSGAVAAAPLLAPGLAAALAPAPITKPIPKSGEPLPLIGLGTNRFGRLETDAEKERGAAVLRMLADGGGKVVDTSENYGASEDVLGELLESTGARPRVFLATKVAQEGRENGIRTMENSFVRLRTDVIDLMFVHNMRDIRAHLPVMREWKATGRFRYVGVTHSNPEVQEKLAGVMEREELDFVQFNYSVDMREPENRLLPLARDKGIAVMVNLPLGRARPLDRVRDRPFPEWARVELGCQTYAQLLLKFVISHPAVNVAIPGTTNPGHMAENLVAGRGVLADEKQRARIAAIWD